MTARLVSLLVLAALAVASFAGAAFAQDPPAREEQIRRIRQLPPEEKERLKGLLRRFAALPASEREALRAKARELGAERLGELAGRDFAKVRRRHAMIERETDTLVELLGGTERLAEFPPEVRAYLRAEAMRGFQRFVRQRMLEAATLAAGFEQLPEPEKRARFLRAQHAAAQAILAERSEEERAAFLAMSGAEQRAARARLLEEWRRREIVNFAKRFEGARLLPLFEMKPEEVREIAASRVRWFQLAGLLHADGVDRETMRMLAQLRADERAQVALVYESARDFPAADRRQRVEEKIRELYGRASFDTERMRRPGPRFPEILRERVLRERERRARDAAPDPPK